MIGMIGMIGKQSIMSNMYMRNFPILIQTRLDYSKASNPINTKIKPNLPITLF
jgi:hypothetical protein